MNKKRLLSTLLSFIPISFLAMDKSYEPIIFSSAERENKKNAAMQEILPANTTAKEQLSKLTEQINEVNKKMTELKPENDPLMPKRLKLQIKCNTLMTKKQILLEQIKRETKQANSLQINN